MGNKATGVGFFNAPSPVKSFIRAHSAFYRRNRQKRELTKGFHAFQVFINASIINPQKLGCSGAHIAVIMFALGSFAVKKLIHNIVNR